MASSPLDPADRAVLDHLVREGLELLDADRLEAAAANLEEARQLAPDEPTVLAALGELAVARGRPALARARLEAAVVADPTLADARYALARLLEDAGEHAAQAEHDRAVLRLDAAAHRRAGIGGREDLAFIERVVAEVLDQVPEPFASRLHEVPIVLEPRPHEEIVSEGFDPRAFGLFEGPDDLGRRSIATVDPRPTRIVVFFANLLDAFAREDELREQIEITLLHELGHYFGLDEDQVDALGLR